MSKFEPDQIISLQITVIQVKLLLQVNQAIGIMVRVFANVP